MIPYEPVAVDRVKEKPIEGKKMLQGMAKLSEPILMKSWYVFRLRHQG